MNSFIGNGPSDKPNIWNLSIVADMVLQRKRFDQQEDLFRKIRRDFQNKYRMPFVSHLNLKSDPSST